MKMRVLLADDHTLMRAGLRSLLEDHPRIEVIAEAKNGRDAVALAEELKPNIVIMDVSMPELNGIEATRQVLAKGSDVKVIALSIHSDRRFVDGMFAAGASGYLLKDCALEELVRAIETVTDGKLYLSPGVAGGVIITARRNLL